MVTQLHFETALPSIVCLAVLCFLPSAARKSLDYWRAIQVYDRNERKASTQPPAKASAASKWKASIGVLLFLALEVAFFASGGMDWEKVSPLVGSIRQAVPHLLLTLFVSMAGATLIHKLFVTFATVSRTFNAKKVSGEIPVVKFSKGDTEGKVVSVSKLRFRSVMLAYITLCIAIIVASTFINDQAPKYLAILSGAIILIVSLPFQQLHVAKRLSFRGLVVYPVYVVAITIAIFLVAFGIAFSVEWYQDMRKGNNVNPAKQIKSSPSSSSWGFDKMDQDLAIVQTISISYSYLVAISVGMTGALVCFAYRFDASQMGHATVEEAEADEIVRQSKQEKDAAGRAPIPLHTVALPRSTLSSKDLPTFKAAFYTLVGSQLVGTAVDAITGWQKSFIYPTHASQLSNGNFIGVSVWPLLAYPLVCVAMIASVSLRSDRTFKSLWTYGEQWLQEDKPSLPTKAQDIAELEKAEEIDEVA